MVDTGMRMTHGSTFMMRLIQLILEENLIFEIRTHLILCSFINLYPLTP